MINLYNISMFRLGQKLACFLPRGLVIFLAQCLAFERYTFARQERAWVRKNLHYCGVNTSTLNVFRVIKNYAVCIADMLRIPKYNHQHFKNSVMIKGLDNLDKAFAMNQGVILLTGHLGNWDLAGVYLAGLGYPLNALTEDIPGLSGFFNNLRKKTGMQTFYAQERDKIAAALVNKKILVLVADRDFTGWGVRVKFLAGEKILPIGPSSFAKRHNAPIVVGNFVLNDDKQTYRMEFCEPILPQERTYKELMQMIADKLSYFIRKNPLQWFVLQDEWR